MRARVRTGYHRWVTTACEVQAGQYSPHHERAKIVFKNRVGDVVSIVEMERPALFELCNSIVDHFEFIAAQEHDDAA